MFEEIQQISCLNLHNYIIHFSMKSTVSIEIIKTVYFAVIQENKRTRDQLGLGGRLQPAAWPHNGPLKPPSHPCK